MLWPEVSARQAYPLYYGVAPPVCPCGQRRQSGARAESVLRDCRRRSRRPADVPLRSGHRIGSRPARGAGLLLAFSYTFWSQAIIAEVYTLHLALVLCVLPGAATRYARASVPARASRSSSPSTRSASATTCR